MYSDKPLHETAYVAGENPLEDFQYFDPMDEHLTFSQPNPAWSNMAAYHGGVRKRVFGVDPLLSKVCLIKMLPGISSGTGHHIALGATLSSLQGTVLHFKFVSTLLGNMNLHKDRTKDSYDSVSSLWKSENDAYSQVFSGNENLKLHYEKSLRYEGPQQLQELGFMKSSESFEAFAAQKSA